MSKITNFKDLIVWQKSYALAGNIYKNTKNFPKSEIFGLADQMRRSAVSIPSNIAEGFGRQHKKEFVQFLRIAYGSSTELETQLMLSKDLNYLNELNYSEMSLILGEIQRMLIKLTSVVRTANG